MQSSENANAGNSLLKKLRDKADANGLLRYDTFIDTVLYDPKEGYYRRNQPRIGKSSDTDFYTNTSLNPVFAKLILATVRSILAPPEELTFVEIGTEPGGGILAGFPDSVREYREIPIGKPMEIPPNAVVFSNELFDAQPFRRFRKSSSGWRELAVRVDESGLREVLHPELPEIDALPKEASLYYTIDLPTGAEQLLTQLAAQPWRGLFLAVDYGLDEQAVFHQRPQGTARTYHRHRQSQDLLDHPGDIDITHHLIWDRMEAILREHGFSQVQTLRQEAFFMQHASSAIETIFTNSQQGIDHDKQTLMEILHPENLGAKFQILSGIRNS